MGILFFGTPVFAIPTLKALIESGEEVSAVITQPDKPGGRGRKPIEPPVKRFAMQNDLPVLQPERIKDPKFYETISDYSPEFIVVVAYGMIIPPEILKLPERGPINVHASLLPKYRGAAPIQWAIINGESKTGVTTMLMDEGLDTGDILLHAETEISMEDTTATLSERLASMGAELLLDTLKGLRKGSIKPLPQEGEPSYAPQIRKEDGLINWGLSAQEIQNRIRGLYPWPTAYTYYRGKLLKILRAGVLEGSAPPGTVASRQKKRLLIGTGSGLLEPLEVQLEGKRPTPIISFLQGQGRELREGDSLGI